MCCCDNRITAEMIFVDFSIAECFEKLSNLFQLCLKADDNKGHFYEDLYEFMNASAAYHKNLLAPKMKRTTDIE